MKQDSEAWGLYLVALDCVTGYDRHAKLTHLGFGINKPGIVPEHTAAPMGLFLRLQASETLCSCNDCQYMPLFHINNVAIAASLNLRPVLSCMVLVLDSFNKSTYLELSLPLLVSCLSDWFEDPIKSTWVFRVYANRYFFR